MRDWSAEGAEEREQCFAPIVRELLRVCPVTPANRNLQRVLVPGAGLARLVLEICCAGFATQGNEFSYHMLLVANFLLNASLAPEAKLLYPFCDQASNCKSAEDRTRPVRIPDVSPASLLKGPENDAPGCAPVDFSMVAGEFLEVYKEQSSTWRAVATCFFLDTAPVALDYVETIYRLLEPGGAWVNLGPLLYHWVPTSEAELHGHDDRFAQSVEFSWDEIKHAIQAVGFTIVNEEWRNCRYTANHRSMMKTDYECVFFTAVKPAQEKLP